MKFNKIKIVLLLVLPVLGCNTISELKLQSNSDSVIDKETSIPFKYTKKLIIVNAYLNDSKKANSFIFDTGAFQSKVEYDLSEKLNLETITIRNNGTAQGVKREIEITSVDSIRLSTSSFFNIGAGKLKYDALSYSPCIAKDGIIGANLIKLAHWKIDYVNKEMKVSKKPYNSKTVSDQVKKLYADPYIKTRKGIFEYILGGLTDTKLLEVRVFDEATKKTVYAKQKTEAEKKGISNCPLCAVSNNTNKTKVWSLAEMDADHVSAWSKGGATDIKNCEMLCKTHNRAKGNK